MKQVLFSAFTMFFLMLSTVFAHDFWIEKKDNKLFVVSGHDDKWDNYQPDRIKEVKAFDTQGNAIDLKVVRQQNIIYVEQKDNVAMVNVFFDNYHWVKTTEGWKNITKRDAQNQNLQIIESGQSFKYAKYYAKWSDVVSKPIGTKIELTPLKNPLSLKPGNTLEVRVLLDGKPLQNAPIFLHASHNENTKTSKEGIANVTVKKGHNIISTTAKVPLTNNPDADQLYLRASISFEVK